MPEKESKVTKPELLIACLINLLAVSSVFMTQSIFLELSRSFQIDNSHARFSFSIVSLFYAIAFVLIGPITDRYDLPKISFTGLLLLSVTVFSSSYMTNFNLFIIAMALTGTFAALIPASMFPHIAKTSPPGKIGSASSLYILFCIGGGSLSSVFLGPVWHAYGWDGVTLFCSGFLIISLLIVSVIAIKESNIAAYRDV